MGKNIIQSFLEQGRETNSTQVVDFFPHALNLLTEAIGDGQKVGIAELADKAIVVPDYSDLGVRAKFIVCPTIDFLKKYSLAYAENFAPRFEAGLKLYFSKFLGLKVDFSVRYCAKPEKGAEALAFDTFEDIKTIRGLENELQRADRIFKSTSDNKYKDRGLKVLVLQPDNGQHSSAQQNGMFAYLNVNHLSTYSHDGIIMKQQDYEYFDITLVHEVCHLFGLSDRYQFVQHYTQLKDNCYSIDGQAELVPIAVDPNIDPEALTQDMALNNLMYGKDNWCKALTRYQKNVILGIAGPQKNGEMEPPYNQITFLLPHGASLTTAGTYIKKTGYESIESVKTVILGSGIPNGIYMYVKQDGQYVQDFTGQNIFFNNSAVGNGFDTQVGTIVRDPDGNILPSSNALGLQILNSPDCDDPKLRKDNDKNFQQGSDGK
jgi:hypothetical protein